MERGRKKKYVSLAEVQAQISALEMKVSRTIPASDSTQIPSLKRFLVACNSLAIVFLQYDLVREALDLLTKANFADVKLFKTGIELDRLWSPRISTYTNLAYLFQRYSPHRVRDYTSAIKFVYDAQTLLLGMERAGVRPGADWVLAINLLTFNVLWKLGKRKEAEQYVLICVSTINTLIETRTESRLSRHSQLNLYGLIVMAYSATLVTVHQDLKGAEQTIQRALRYMDTVDLPVISLLERLGEELKTHLDSHTASKRSEFESGRREAVGTPPGSIPGIPSSYFRRDSSVTSKSWSWLISEEYEMIFFATLFIPFISDYYTGQSTPLIRSKELENARKRAGAMRREDWALISKDSSRLNTSIPSSRSILPSTRTPRPPAHPTHSLSPPPSDSSFLLTRPSTHRAAQKPLPFWGDEGNYQRPKGRISTSRGEAGSRSFRLNQTSLEDSRRRKVYLSPALAPIPASRQLRLKRRPKDEVIMVEFSPQAGAINLQPLSTHISSAPQRVSKSAYSQSRKRSQRADQSVLIDIVAKTGREEESNEEPKETVGLY